MKVYLSDGVFSLPISHLYIYSQLTKDAEQALKATFYKLVYLYSTYSLKLHIIVHLFAAYQKCEATSAN